MITRVRIEGEAGSAEQLNGEFIWLVNKIAEVFDSVAVATMPAHSVLEKCDGDPDVSVHGNWKGRSVIHFDTQKLNDQIPTEAA